MTLLRGLVYRLMGYPPPRIPGSERWEAQGRRLAAIIFEELTEEDAQFQSSWGAPLRSDAERWRAAVSIAWQHASRAAALRDALKPFDHRES